MRRSALTVSVRLHPASGHPRQLHLRERWQRVTRVLDTWRYGGRWWLREAPRNHYLLELEGGLVIEVAREGDAWRLTRTAD